MANNSLRFMASLNVVELQWHCFCCFLCNYQYITLLHYFYYSIEFGFIFSLLAKIRKLYSQRLNGWKDLYVQLIFQTDKNACNCHETTGRRWTRFSCSLKERYDLERHKEGRGRMLCDAHQTQNPLDWEW